MDPQRPTDRDTSRGSTTRLAARPASLTSPLRFVPPPIAPPPAPPTAAEVEELLAEERESARRAGLAAARAEIAAMEAAHREAIARIGRAATALERAAAELHAHDRAVLDQFEDHAIDLAVQLATAALGRELDAVEAPVIEAAKRAAAFVPDRSDVVVRAHPADLDQVVDADGEALPALAEALGGRHSITVVADPSIEPGACAVHVGALRIDTQLGPALERMHQALRS